MEHDLFGKPASTFPDHALGVLGLGHDIGPMIDGLPRLADRLGEGVLAIVGLPLAAVVELHQMAQGTTGAEELPFGILALDFHGECLGHGPLGLQLRDSAVSLKVVKIKSIEYQP